MDVHFPVLEPEVIELVSDDEAIGGIYEIENIIIMSDDSDLCCVMLINHVPGYI